MAKELKKGSFVKRVSAYIIDYLIIVKECFKMAEDAKVAVRNIRRDGMDTLKKMKNNKELSEDVHAVCEKEIDKVISETVDKIDKMCADKEKDIMSV